MSYSFAVKGKTKDDAVNAVRVELEKVVAGQPIHAADRDQALAAAASFVSVLMDDDQKDISVSVHGSVSTHNGVIGASIGVSASLIPREAAP